MPPLTRAMRIAVLPAALLALLASSAGAQTASGVEGRWRSQQPALTLDIQRCTGGFCGMVVDASGRCGQRVLSFPAPVPPDALHSTSAQGTGRFQLPGHRAPLDARVALGPPPQGVVPMLHIVGVDEGPMGFMRRTFPFEARFARIGDAACAVQPVS